jgi:transposase-like protein
MKLHWAEAVVVNESIDGGVVQAVVKRQRRSAEDKRRIVEATLVPKASIARVACEHGVNANQVFQWRYVHRCRRQDRSTLNCQDVRGLASGVALTPPWYEQCWRACCGD